MSHGSLPRYNGNPGRQHQEIAMSVPLDHVAQAAKFLTSGSGTPKERLVMCGKVLRMALMIAEDWTPDLRTEATRVLATLLDGRTLEATVAQMDEKAASKCLGQLAKDVTELANGIERARSQKRLPRK
jgi:hypothetical protein